jgi:predicted kinase
MIVIINGPCGIGKTAAAWELNSRFDRSVMLDGDYIGAVHPFEIYDDARVAYLYQTLRYLVAYHIEQGDYHNFVINYVFETPESLAELCHLLAALDDEIYSFCLTATDEEIEMRLRKREQESDADLRWYLKRYKELIVIQTEAARRGDLGLEIDTSGLSAGQVADVIWQQLP